MKRIALKIDVDTCQGALTGVPALLAMLDRYQASGTFFFSLGPDRSGCQSHATSLKRFYPRSTRLYGRWLPAPDIGQHCACILHETLNAGFEIGVGMWNRVAWEENIGAADSSWVVSFMQRAQTEFTAIVGERPAAIAAPGWRSSRRALRLTQRFDCAYASDCRGSHPFIPVVEGEISACPQLPTTLPTLDEVLVIDPTLSAEQGAERILQLSKAIPGDHVCTLRAELEGNCFTNACEHLLRGWQEAGIRPVALRDLYISLDMESLPRHAVLFDEIPGRPGKRMLQGEHFPKPAESFPAKQAEHFPAPPVAN